MIKRFAALTALALAFTLAVAGSAAAKPQQIDGYCSPTGDFCQEITLNKKGVVKFGLQTFAFSGEYTICVKGPSGKDCEDFRLESRNGAYSDKVNWQRNFPDDFGVYKVVWKLQGVKIGKALDFVVETQ